MPCSTIQEGIQNHGRTVNQKGQTIYAYEVDGMGNATVMDDSNVPNLIAAPYLGYCSEQEEDYLQTKRTLLSKEKRNKHTATPYHRYYGNHCTVQA